MRVFFLCLLLAMKIHAQQNADGILVGSMHSGGIDSLSIQRIEAEIQNGTYPNIHSLLIARHNNLVYEHYWPGKDEILGNDLGIVTHDRDSLHDIRSVTKSFVATCIGIALGQGRIKSIDQKVLSFFPEYAQLDTGMKSSLTIRHLLTMSSGLEWNENLPYSDPRNSEISMDKSIDPVGYVLKQPINHKPGTVWDYNGGNTQVLAAIVKKVSGKEIDAFAREYLFEPLGISRWQWLRSSDANQLPAAASGLRLCSRDLLKLGLLYNNRGAWKGKQLVPAWWVDSASRSSIERSGPGGSGGYGYQFWIFPVMTKQGLIPGG